MGVKNNAHHGTLCKTQATVQPRQLAALPRKWPGEENQRTIIDNGTQTTQERSCQHKDIKEHSGHPKSVRRSTLGEDQVKRANRYKGILSELPQFPLLIFGRIPRQ